MAGRGVVFGAKQIEFGLRHIHLGKTDVHRGSERALRQRIHLTQSHAAKVECRLRHFENRFRGQRPKVSLLHFHQYLSAGIGHVLILRCVAQLGALLQAGGAAEIGQQLIGNQPLGLAAINAGRGYGAGRENRTAIGAHAGNIARERRIIGRANLLDHESAGLRREFRRGDARVISQGNLLSFRQGHGGWSLRPRGQSAHERKFRLPIGSSKRSRQPP